MIMLWIYLIIGAAMVTFTTTSMILNGRKKKEDFRDRNQWLAIVVVTLLWPMILGRTMIKVIKIKRVMRKEEL